MGRIREGIFSETPPTPAPTRAANRDDRRGRTCSGCEDKVRGRRTRGRDRRREVRRWHRRNREDVASAPPPPRLQRRNSQERQGHGAPPPRQQQQQQRQQEPADAAASNPGQYFSTPAPVVRRSKPDAEGEYAAKASTGPPGLRDDVDGSRHRASELYPGQHRIICPTCNGGSSGERSLAVHVEDDGKSAQWCCHRANCEWSGGTSTDGRSRASRGTDSAVSNRRVAKPKLPAPEDLQRIGPGEMTPAAATSSWSGDAQGARNVV